MIINPLKGYSEKSVVVVKKYNECVDKFNECRSIVIEQNKALKENQKLLKEIEKHQNLEKWKSFGKGAAVGAVVVIIGNLIFGR